MVLEESVPGSDAGKRRIGLVALLDGALAALAAALLLWAAWQFVAYARNAPPSFDGAMNLNVAASVAHGTGYGFVYDFYYPFPAQTDGPFILPAAIVFWLAGVNLFTAQFVSLVYTLAFFVVATGLFLALEARLWLALLGAVLMVCTPGFAEFTMNGFGEIIVMVWFLTGLIVAARSLTTPSSRNGLIGAGVLFGLAFLTKVVAFICVGPALLAIVAAPFFPSNWRARAAALMTGFLPPIAAWEVFRLISTGGPAGYGRWWTLQWKQIHAQSGATEPIHGLAPLLGKAREHLEILAKITGAPTPWLVLYLVVPVLLVAWLIRSGGLKPDQKLILATLALLGALYFVWWIFVTPTSQAWLRRILDGLVIQQALVFGLVAAALSLRPSFSRAKANAFVALLVGAPALIGAAYVVAKGQFLSRPLHAPAERAAEMLKLAEMIHNLPADAVMFGEGWWKAPALALFSGRPVMNLEHWESPALNALPEKYFVTDYEAQGIAKAEIAEALAPLQYSAVYQSPAGSLYRIEHVDPYVAFDEKDRKVEALASGFDLRVADYAPMRGFYPTTSPAPRWSKPESAILLKRRDQTELDLEVWTPGHLALKPNEPTLRVTSPGCIDESAAAPSDTLTNVRLHLTCPPSVEDAPMQIDFAFNNHIRFPQQIDADSRLLSFVLLSARLVNAPAAK